MVSSSRSRNGERIYRIDKFIVPDAARDEFIENVRSTHEFLRALPGFVEDSIFERSGGPGEFDFVTIAVWRDAAAIEGAREAVKARHAIDGFDPGEMFDRLGITADLVNYRRTEI